MKFLATLLLIILLILPVAYAQTDAKHACGAASLYHLATLLGLEVSLDTANTAVKAKQEGGRIASFVELIDCGNAIGLELQGAKLTYAELQMLNTPVIAHLKTTFADENPSAADGTVGHFIVVEHATDKWVRMFDTPRNTLRDAATVISCDRFLELWTGKILVLSQKQQSYWQPALVASPTLFDFGKGKTGEYGIPVQLRNVSITPLKILNIAANCNCTITKKQSAVIRARGSTFLDVTWDANAANRSLFTTIHLETEAPKRPHTFISLGLIREFSLVCIPETLSIQGTSTSQIKRTVAIQNLNETAAKILKIEPSQAWIQPVLRSDAVISPWRHANIELYFETEQMPRDKRVDETLTVHYEESDGKTKSITLPISGKVNPRYTLTPKRFFFGRIKATEGNTKVVVLHNYSDTDIQIEKVETDVGTVQVDAFTDENRYELRLTLPPLLPTGILKGEVRIHTNHPKMHIIKIQVFALVTK